MNARQNFSAEADAFANLADPAEIFKNPAQLSFVRMLIDLLRQRLSNLVRSDRAAPHIILLSPNGTAFIVEVGDDGILTTRNARGA